MLENRRFTFESQSSTRQVMKSLAEVQGRVIQWLAAHRNISPIVFEGGELRIGDSVYPSPLIIRDGIDGRLFDKLMESLSHHDLVLLEGSGREGHRIRYKPHFDSVKDKEGLKKLLVDHPNGVSMKELRNAYLRVAIDVEALVEEGFVFQIENKEAKTTVLFHNDPSLHLKIDPRVKSLWHEVTMKDEVTTERTLVDSGVISGKTDKGSTDTLRPRITISKPKRKPSAPVGEKKAKRGRFERLTNVHMKDTLKFLQ